MRKHIWQSDCSNRQVQDFFAVAAGPAIGPSEARTTPSSEDSPVKKSYLLLLLLAALLAVPAIAQNQPTNSPDQSKPQATEPQNTETQAAQPQTQQAQPAQTQSADQTQGATGKEPLKLERHEGFWGHLNPFAR